MAGASAKPEQHARQRGTPFTQQDEKRKARRSRQHFPPRTALTRTETHPARPSSSLLHLLPQGLSFPPLRQCHHAQGHPGLETGKPACTLNCCRGLGAAFCWWGVSAEKGAVHGGPCCRGEAAKAKAQIFEALAQCPTLGFCLTQGTPTTARVCAWCACLALGRPTRGATGGLSVQSSCTARRQVHDVGSDQSIPSRRPRATHTPAPPTHTPTLHPRYRHARGPGPPGDRGPKRRGESTKPPVKQDPSNQVRSARAAWPHPTQHTH